MRPLRGVRVCERAGSVRVSSNQREPVESMPAVYATPQEATTRLRRTALYVLRKGPRYVTKMHTTRKFPYQEGASHTSTSHVMICCLSPSSSAFSKSRHDKSITTMRVLLLSKKSRRVELDTLPPLTTVACSVLPPCIRTFPPSLGTMSSALSRLSFAESSLGGLDGCHERRHS